MRKVDLDNKHDVQYPYTTIPPTERVAPILDVAGFAVSMHFHHFFGFSGMKRVS